MKKTEIKKNKSKKKKYDSDLVAVIFIVAIIIVVAFLFSFFRAGENRINLNGTKADIERQQKEQTKEIIITVGVTSVLVIAFCVGYKIKRNRQKRKEAEEKLRKQQELEAAISRLSQKQSKNTYNMYSNELYNRHRQDRYYDDLDDEVMHDSRIRHKYDFNQLDLDDDEYDDESEKYDDIRRKFKDNFDDGYEDDYEIDNDNHKKKLRIMALVAGVIVIAIIVVVALL